MEESTMKTTLSRKTKRSGSWRNKELLGNLYWKKELSMYKIAKLLGCNPVTVYYWMDKFQIPSRSRSEVNKGKNNPMYGKNHPAAKPIEENKLRTLYLKKRYTISKLASELNCSTGKIRYWLNRYNLPHRSRGEANIGRKQTTETREKISEAMKGDQHPCYGKTLSEETRRKISESRVGDKNPMWRGGVSFEPYPPMFNETLKRKIRERDNYICQITLCGKLGKTVHHIDYDKNNNEPKNLITLCKSCHTKTNTNRGHWINYFNNPLQLQGIQIEA